MSCANGASEKTRSCVKPDILTVETSRCFLPARRQTAKTDASHPSAPFTSRPEELSRIIRDRVGIAAAKEEGGGCGLGLTLYWLRERESYELFPST